MAKSKSTQKTSSKSKKAKKSKVVKQLLLGSMIVGGVELVSEEAWAQACIIDADCGAPPWTCIQDPNMCNNFCSYGG